MIFKKKSTVDPIIAAEHLECIETIDNCLLRQDEKLDKILGVVTSYWQATEKLKVALDGLTKSIKDTDKEWRLENQILREKLDLYKDKCKKARAKTYKTKGKK
jgi:uncharacterized coiled-coil protein SlyX